MRILDIDLDFFLNDKAYSRVTSTERLDPIAFTPWPNSEVKNFLEKHCGLSKQDKKTGKLFTHHIEVFDFLDILQKRNGFNLKFSIDHVDAHADLGWGDASFQYISSEILFKSIDQRSPIAERNGWSGLSSGNFLAFLVALRWVENLNYINEETRAKDIPPFLLEDFELTSGFIQLKKYTPDQMYQIIHLGSGSMIEKARRIPPIELEPRVPFSFIDNGSFYNSNEYDYVFLTKSPGFTPLSSDALIPLILDYVILE